MTHAMAVEELQQYQAVGELDGDEIAAPLLAAIQHSYEEAKARIDDVAGSSWPAAPGGTDPHPGTEKIDLRLIKLPTVLAVTTPPTRAMSLAAKFLAEQPVSVDAAPPAAASGPTPAHHTRSARRGPEAPVTLVPSDLPTAPRRRTATVAAAISRWFAGSAAHAPIATASDG